MRVTDRPSIVVLLAVVLGSLAAACAPAPPASVDPVTALRIAAPWVLDDAFPDVSQQIVEGVVSDEGFRDATVKHVSGPEGQSAFLLVADAGLAADTDLATFIKGLSTGTGTGAGVETMGDHEVAILQTPDGRDRGVARAPAPRGGLRRGCGHGADHRERGQWTPAADRTRRAAGPQPRSGDDGPDQGADGQPTQEPGRVSDRSCPSCAASGRGSTRPTRGRYRPRPGRTPR